MRQLTEFSLARAWTALNEGDVVSAFEWLQSVPDAKRPRELVAEIGFAQGKLAASKAMWAESEQGFKAALGGSLGPIAEQRIALLRRLGPGLEDDKWDLLQATVEAPQKLSPDSLAPELDEVYCCGTYHAWHGKGAPWSRFLRLSKSTYADNEEQRAAITLAGRYLSRFLLEATSLVREIDCIVPVPPNFGRYAQRGFSIPIELAQAIQDCLGIPAILDGLKSSDANVELRGLSWSERIAAIRDAFLVDRYDSNRWPNVLLVDDIVTSGATLRETARILRLEGANRVFGVALAHTEG